MKRILLDTILLRGLESEIEACFEATGVIARATFQQSIKTKQDAVASIKYNVQLIEGYINEIEKIKCKREKVRDKKNANHWGF